jgi:hypothetical protein
MRALFVAVCLAGAAAPAHAQPAAALGHPLKSPDTAAGEVSVRVIAGSPSNPVASTEVTLVVNGTPRIARTDDAGRAFFKDLPAGATVQAKIKDEDGKDVLSDEFPLPTDQGVRLMLTTRPVDGGGGGGGGAPFAGGAGAGAMPEPRQMSGEPRAEQGDEPGTITVRVTYNDFKDTPAGVTVTLVAYHSDMTVSVGAAKTDDQGRARFTGLDRGGATSYFAVAQLPRAGAVDRLVSSPIVLDPQAGVRVMLSAEKRDSTAAPVDDLNKLEEQDPVPPAGKVAIELAGVPDPNAVITLVDAATSVELAKGKPVLTPPDPRDVQAEAQFQARTNVPPNSIDIQVHGGANQANDGLADIAVKVTPVKGDGAPVETRTATNGTVRIALDGKAQGYIATLVINGKPLTSQPFDLSKTGGVLDVEARWQSTLQAGFDVTPKPDEVFYAEAHIKGQFYRSVPFQLVEGHGTRIAVYIYPRILMSFSLHASVDDEFLGVSGKFSVRNNSWAPFVASPDGMVIPLPKHFRGAIIAERNQGEVSVAPDEGFRIVRPIPPGMREFVGGFSLPIEHGKVKWDLDLPWGAFSSGMEIVKMPGMGLKTPPGVQSKEVDVPQGTFIVLPEINILPNKSMSMIVTGMPAVASWRIWLPRIVGVLVIVIVLAGIAFSLARRPQSDVAAAERDARRSKLLDELVELEKGGKGEKRREAIIAELEQLWE